MAGYKRKVMRGPKGKPKKWAGTWEFRLYKGLDPVPDDNGKHQKVYVSEVWPPADERDPKHLPGERLADKALAAWVTKLEEKGELPGTRASVSYVVEQHLLLLEKLGRSPTTLQGYRSIKKVWIDPQIGPKRIDELVPADLKRVHAAMTSAGRSNSRIRQMHAIVQGALGMTVEEEWLDRNVASLIKRPKQIAADIYCPEPDEVDQFFMEAKGDQANLGTAIALGATLGRRLGELCALRLSDIDFEATTTIQTKNGPIVIPGLIRIDENAFTVTGAASATKDTKTHSNVTIWAGALALERIRARLVFIEKRAKAVGTELIEDPYLLAVKSNGSGPPRPDYYSKRMTKLRDKLGNPDMHFHCLRHFHAVSLLDGGVDLIVIARRLGHADASMLAKVYANHGRVHADAAAGNVMGGLLQLGSGV